MPGPSELLTVGSNAAFLIVAWVPGYSFISLMLCYYLPILVVKSQICRPVEGFWD